MSEIASTGARGREDNVPLTLLIVSHSSELYGAERSLLDLIENLDREVFNPIAVVPNSGPFQSELDRYGIKAYVVRSPAWLYRRRMPLSFLGRLADILIFLLPSIVRLMKIMKREGVDIVYSNTIVKSAGALAAFVLKKPHVWHIREILFEEKGFLRFFLPDRYLFAIISRLSDVVIANSKATARQFAAGRQPIVVYNGIDPDKYRRPDDIKSNDCEKWTVLVIASLQKIKAQDAAIRAVDIVKERIPAIELRIVGEGDDRYADYLEELAGELGVSDRVDFCGYLSDIRGNLCDAKAVLIPSLLESFGRVAIEAMAAGVPVIASDVYALGEIVLDGYNGFLVPPNSPREMAERLLLLHDDPQLHETLRENAREWIRTRFSLDRYVREMESIFRNAALNQ
jgi:glycosyltransferase involved in cell wall biosynthesis